MTGNALRRDPPASAAGPKQPPPAATLPALFVFAFLSLASVGTALVVSAWLAAGLGSTRLVGQLFFLGSLAALLTSLYAGPVIDRNSRISVIRLAQGLRLAASLVLLAGTLDRAWLLPALLAQAALASTGTALQAGALDGVFQFAVGARHRGKGAIRLSIVRQAGIAAGTAAAGLTLHRYGPAAGAALGCALCALQLFVVEKAFRIFTERPPVSPRGPLGLVGSWREGLRITLRNPDLVASILAFALVFSVAQMTNVLMPDFTRGVLMRGSDVYGALEMGWAAGGGAALLAAALVAPARAAGAGAFLALVPLGLLMIVLAMHRSVPGLICLYALLGALFSLSRAMFDGRILTLASPSEIGRVRSAALMLTNLAGLAIYLSPTLFGNADPERGYAMWGAAVSLGGLCLALGSGMRLGEPFRANRDGP